MVKKQRQSADAEPSAAAAKKARTSQPGIAAALARGAPAAATELVLEQPRRRDLLDRRLTEELTSQGDKYLQAWSEKCYGLRDGSPGKGAAAATAVGGSSLKARRAAAAGYSKEDADLDAAAVRYLDVFRHLQQQAFRHDAAFEARQLELLVLVLRSDVIHAMGDVSHQAATLLHAYLRRFPYASLGRHRGGAFQGRPFLILDEQAAWEPLAAVADLSGLSKKYIFEEAIKDAGHNYRLDHGATSLLSAAYKKGGRLKTCFELLRLCLERAVDSVDVDHNGDLLLLRYLLTLMHQDLHARLAVFAAYADVEGEAAQRKRAAVLQHSLLWRIWLDEQETDKSRQDLLRLVMRLIVGVASEEDLQEVDERHTELDKDAERAAPCIATPRELAAMAARLLGMLLDLFGAAEAAGGFHGTAAHRMHRANVRLRLDQALKELFWKNSTDAVCGTDATSRAFLAALAPAHRLRLLALVAMQHVVRAYYAEEAARRPAVARAKELEALVATGDSGPFRGAFQADPVVALQCLNQDQPRCLKVFSLLNRDTAINNLAVLAAGIALAAHSLAAGGGSLPECAGAGGGGGGGGGAGAEGRALLRREAHAFLKFLADRHREFRAGDKRDWALSMSRASLFDLLHAQAAIAAL